MVKLGSRFLITLLIMAVCVVSGWSGDNLPQIVCIGDQITKGQQPQDMIGNGTRWVDKFASFDKNSEIINAGVNGLKSGNVSYLNDVLSQYPAAQGYIIYLGINDLVDVTTIDPGVAASIGAKVLRMLDKIRSVAPKAEVTVIAPQRVNAAELSTEWKEKGFAEHTEVLSDLVSASIEVAAGKRNVRFIDLTDKISSDLLLDGVELNAKGHTVIAEIIFDELSHKYIAEKPENTFAEIAPPPVGKAMTNPRGTDDLIKGLAADIDSLKDMGSAVERAENTADYREAHIKNYVNKTLSENIVTKTAYLLGKNIAKEIVEVAEQCLQQDANALMEAEFANLDMGARDESNAVEIVYELPEESRVESFITGVAKNKGEYEVLAAAVDWSGIEIPEVQQNENDVEEVNEVQESIVEQDRFEVAEKSVEQKINEQTAEDIIVENQEIVELWLPEFDVLDGMEKAVEVVELVDENMVADAAKLEEIVTQEVKEVFAAGEPIEYTGYAVFVHTGFSE